MKIRTRLALACSAVILAACGGGSGDDGSVPPQACTAAGRNAWLHDYFDEWYFWYAITPRPDPSGYTKLADYFDALLFPGDATFPRDRFSTYESTESFNQFFGDGRTLGYGLAVAGLEVEGRPDLPLRIRYVEPKSDAARQGLRRGEQVLQINGRAASEYIAADDFSVLSATAAGQTLNLLVRGSGGDRSVTLTADVHDLTPVSATAVVTTPLGRRMGYVHVKDMITQVGAPLDTAFAQFRTQGVSDVVIDLRYNGGGLVSVGRDVASYAGGAYTGGRDYVRLLYNDRRAVAENQTFRFATPASGLGFARAYVLSGPRTCSASEQVINGLRGAGVEVVQIGDTTCGKPVGFLPTPHCGNTFSVVNFESVNARNEGRYFDGLAPTCAVADDLDHALGAPAEALLAAARAHADTGACPAGAEPLAAGTRRTLAAREREAGRRLVEPGERRGMIGR